MPPVVIDLQQTDDSRDVVHRAVQALSEGKVVVFPSDTVYLAAVSAMNPAAVARLVEGLGQGSTNRLDGAPHFSLGTKSSQEALDYAPTLSSMGQRLARRCWPGPVVLSVPAEHPESLVRQLPASVRQVLVQTGYLAMRAPAHRMLNDVLKLLVGPVVLGAAQVGNEPPPATAQEAAGSLGDLATLVLDAGPCRFGQPASVVRVFERRFEIVSPGVVTEQNLNRLASQIIVFVCTGNTCRSPMAETLCRKMAAEKLGCPPEKLEEHGVIVLSAGISAAMGSRASPEAVQVLREDFSADLSNHVSQPLTEQMIRQADLLLVMTRGHRQAILSEFPEAAGRTRLLSRNEADVSDPIGGPVEMYQRTAQQIEANLRLWLSELFP